MPTRKQLLLVIWAVGHACAGADAFWGHGKNENTLGITVDYPLDRYDMADVNGSVALAISSDAVRLDYARRLLEQRHTAAKRACARKTRVLPTGGWCLDKPRRGRLPHNHFPADVGIVSGMFECVVAKGESIADFGAGIGQYYTALSAALAEAGKPNQTLRYTGYDGAGNVVEASGGLVHFFDLTTPMFLPVADWVMSLEVGEHIPEEKEHLFFRNLHAHNCIGVVLSWARLRQDGHGHINNHSPEYIAHQMHKLGYYKDEEMTKALHKHNSYWWFDVPDNPAAWRRYTPRTDRACLFANVGLRVEKR